MRIARYIAIASCASLAGACSGSSSTDIRQTVGSSEWFGRPLQIAVSVGGSDYNITSGTIGSVPSKCIVSKLLENGHLKLEPDTSSSPWWSPSVTGAVGASGGFLFNVGQRNVTSITNEKRWKENSISYHAATLVYSIKDSGILNKIGATYGPFEARVVYENDPAVGEWRLQTAGGGVDESAELAALTSAAFPQHECNDDIIVSAVNSAKAAAFDQIDKSLSDQGVISKGAAPNTLVSKQSGLAYYLGYSNVPTLRGVNIRQIPIMAASMCQKIKVGPYRNWRLSTFDDLRKITSNGAHAASRLPIDVPDRRHWGEFSSNVPGIGAVIPTADPPRQNYGAASPYQPFAGLNMTQSGEMREDELVEFFELRDDLVMKVICTGDV